MPSQESSTNIVPQHSSLNRKVRIKNAARIKNIKNARNRYQQAKFPNHGIQKAKNIRTSNLSQTSKRDEALGKRSERIKIKKQNYELSASKHSKEDLEDQASDMSSISEVSTINSDVSNKRTPSSASRYAFKSKRLQELQEKMESETTEDVNMREETSSVEMRRNSKDQSELGADSESERNSRPRSRRSSLEQVRSSADEGQGSEKSVLKKKRLSGKKTHSRLQAVKDDDEIPSSSDDEESSKPLSQVKKELKKDQPEEKQDRTERVVKKVIKVVKKIRTKSGETKTKVVKIIKKIGVRKKEEDADSSLVPGRRRIRCGKCKGCRITEDCGDCRWCM